MKSSGDRFLRLIGVFKLLKAGLLIAVGFGAFKLIHKDLGSVLERWIEACGFNPGSHFLDMALAKASSVSPDQIKKVGVGSFIYAGLFLIEGVGLTLRKTWAEWVTVIITGSLVPVELYEIHRHPTMIRCGVLAINLAIVAYLVHRIRRRRSA